MSARTELRQLIYELVKNAMDRPKYRAADDLTDKLMIQARQAQHDAWVRGYAAGILTQTSRDDKPGVGRRSPYQGGRHAGAPAAGIRNLVRETPEGPLELRLWHNHNGEWLPIQPTWDGTDWRDVNWRGNGQDGAHFE